MDESNLIVLNESKLDSLSKLLIDTGISVNENELEMSHAVCGPGSGPVPKPPHSLSLSSQ
jgi:hypothetical protein